MSQYDTRAAAYAAVVSADPVKKMQYRAGMEMLGNVNGQQILDIGCGSGQLAAALISQGATVVGYDTSIEQLKLAQCTAPLATLLHGGPAEVPGVLEGLYTFDAAVALLVLMYARDHLELWQFFASTRRMLQPGGRFVGVVINPDFQRLGQAVHNRRLTRLDEDQMQVEFLHNGQPVTSAVFNHFTVDDYRAVAGIDLDWQPLLVDESDDPQFWAGYNADPMYCRFEMTV